MDLRPRTRLVRWRWLRLGPYARAPRGADGRELLRRLNNAARDVQRPVLITSGLRTPREQWAAYQDYLRGGILAAQCCDQATLHPWSRCRQQCASNHCRSRAADCLVRRPGGEWVNVGTWPPMRRALGVHGLCLPVGSGETWHVEIGTTWRS